MTMEIIGWLIALIVAMVLGGAGSAALLDRRFRKITEADRNLAQSRRDAINEEIHEIDRKGMADNDRINAKVDAILRTRDTACAGRRRDDPKPGDAVK